MELEASRLLPVDRETAWRALNDPEILKVAIPGCETMEKTGENEYAIAMTAAVGPVKAKFRAKLTLSDVVEPESYTLIFDGQGGAAGFGKGSAEVALAPEGDQTRLSYRVKAQVGGKIAQVGSRLVDAASKKLADDFFAAFSTELARRFAPETLAAARPPPVRRAVHIAVTVAVILVVAIILWLWRS